MTIRTTIKRFLSSEVAWLRTGGLIESDYKQSPHTAEGIGNVKEKKRSKTVFSQKQ